MAILLSAAAVLAAPAAAAAAVEKPVVRTGGATNLTPSSAQINGAVNPKGAPTRYWFEFGLTRSYGTGSPPADLSKGSKRVRVSAFMGSLAPFTTYHYRLVAENREGRTNGPDRTFRTRREPFGLTLAAKPNPTRVNGPTTLAGGLSGTGNAGQSVRLESNPFPYTQGFLATGNALVTADDGSFSFPVLSVPVNTQFRVVMPDKPEVVSPIVTVGVAPKVGMSVTKTVRRGGLARVVGRIRPGVDGTQVLVQKKSKGRWKTKATTVARHASGDSSKYERRFRLWKGGRFRVLADVENGRYVPGASRKLTIKVKR